ncbi:MAG TPA: OsmC family protein [Thermotogota bacterium]|nr:OsmC family protein [Thermotogota bacterium]HRW34265.1 OsmC family protein [Thermotogota bacterium]
MPNAKFSVHAESENPTKVTVTAGKFKMIIDEPPNLGGTDDGANPVEYVLAALAGCLNVVGKMVAKEMGFAINALSFDLEGELDPAGFMGKSKNVRPGYQHIRVTIDVDSNADDQTLQKWLETIETRCPVSDNLTNTTPVKISLK